MGEPPARTLASRISEQIRRDIIQGHLPPDSKLKPAELSARYGVGVNPIREALSRLVRSGFVAATDQRGFRVAGVSQVELLDITRVRGLIECEALWDSISNADKVWEQRVRGALAQIRRTRMASPDAGAMFLASDWEWVHEAFHAALLSNCSSPLLLRSAAELREKAARYRHLSVHGVHHRNVKKEHVMIAHAALERDRVAACELLASHIVKTTTLVLGNTSPAPT